MSECGENDCYPCVNSKSKSGQILNCRKNRVCYEARCRNCEKEGKLRVYHGETARNVHIRSKEHYRAYSNKSDKSFMHKHVMKEHEGNSNGIIFDWKISGKFKKPLSRQLAEAVKIDKKAKDVNLDSKNEYFSQSVKRLGLAKDDDKEKCGYCGRKFPTIEELQTHEQEFHTEYRCKREKCEYTSIGLKDLKYHTKSLHQE